MKTKLLTAVMLLLFSVPSIGQHLNVIWDRQIELPNRPITLFLHARILDTFNGTFWVVIPAATGGTILHVSSEGAILDSLSTPIIPRDAVFDETENSLIVSAWTQNNPRQGTIIKYNRDLDVIWQTTFSDEEGVYLNGLTRTSDNGFAVTGQIDGKLYLSKFDAEGNPIWSRIYNDLDVALGYSVISTSDEGFAISVNMSGFDWLNECFIMTDSTGRLTALRRFRYPNNTQAYSIIELDDGYLLGGSIVGDLQSVWLGEVSRAGDSLSSAVANVIEENQPLGTDCYAMAKSSNGSVYFLGMSGPLFGGEDNERCSMIGNWTNGEIVWTETIPIRPLLAASICIAEEGDILVAGPGETENSVRLVRLRIDDVRSVDLSNHSVQPQFVSIHPNPTNSSVSIIYELTSAKAEDIVVYDGIGREVLSLNERLTSGRNHITLDLSALPSGYYRIGFGENSPCASFTLIK